MQGRPIMAKHEDAFDEGADLTAADLDELLAARFRRLRLLALASFG
jgi:hypothetical protein